jgi:uncharacterized Rmd1/YagE family protein
MAGRDAGIPTMARTALQDGRTGIAVLPGRSCAILAAMTAASTEPRVSDPVARGRARAVLLGDRLTIDRDRFEHVVSTAPFCYREGHGFVVAFRYGAVVLVGLEPADEDAALALFVDSTATPAADREEERVTFELSPEDEGPAPGGVLRLRALAAPQVQVLADVLGKSVALAHYEKAVAAVFDDIEPAARSLASEGRMPPARKPLVRLIGSSLLTQHRVSGRIAFAEKPDILWDHPELGRLYARLEDEYEIVERGTLLNGKMSVIAAAAETFTDLIDTARSTRLEILIVLLILAEIVVASIPLFRY